MLSYIDNAIQYGEDLEPREPRDEEEQHEQLDHEGAEAF